jgi:oligopeptidase B
VDHDSADRPGDSAPSAPARPGPARELHGQPWVDDFAWLRGAEDPQTQAYLRDERAYYDARTAHTRSLQRTMFDEMARRTLPADRSVSWMRGGLVYYTSTVAGKEYQQFWRSGAQDSSADLLLDENDLAEGSDYFALGLREPSPDGAVLAYSVDVAGDEVFELRFRDLRTGKDLADTIARSYYTGAWSADSTTFFYVVHDQSYRPNQVWRHELGADPASDVLVLQEDDERYELEVEASRSGAFVLVTSCARDSSEVWLVPAADPTAQPRLVQERAPGVLYFVAHAPGPERDELLIVTNDTATEFRLVRAPVSTPDRVHWEDLVGEDPAERLVSADVFAGHVVLTLRRDSSPLLRVLPRDGSRTALDLHPGVEAGSIRLGNNEEYDTATVTVVVDSYTEPTAWYEVDLATGTRTLLKRLEVPGYDREAYVSERFHVEAGDSELVPVTVSRRRDVPLDGTAPCLLYGYGAYEAVDEPEFAASLPSLLDRGVVFAHAHVRGGGENGRRWWLAGSLRHKQNTFGDFIAVADGLDGLVDGRRIVARGLSAGGLLMGAVFSQAPRRWRGVVAEVPFVDVVNTMLDESVPLTAQEWDEWGDPRRAEDFGWMRAYSPYDNVPPLADRPRLLVTGAVHDPRVMYWEPAKWTAKMRASGSTDDRLLLRMELGAGAHIGPSGRYGHLQYEAEVYAWVLDTLERSDSR